ncbi:TIGR00645 family protein [Streptomyces violascens]|uniref:TIGR00645 family protein n=1 Tax=Streptomyces violascens TaxID=67381 RepID=UPI00364F424E
MTFTRDLATLAQDRISGRRTVPHTGEVSAGHPYPALCWAVMRRQVASRDRAGQQLRTYGRYKAALLPANGSAPSLGYALFATRWLQAPLYFGLVAAQAVYVWEFFGELRSLMHGVITGASDENMVMLAVLKLVDVVMIANLLIMVIVGGYETFVSRIGLQNHKDQPEWLSHVNSNVLKVKLAMAIVGISSIHLLQMFVNIHHTPRQELLWGTIIHMAFIVSACLLAFMAGPMEAKAAQLEQQGHIPAQAHHDPTGSPAPTPASDHPA